MKRIKVIILSLAFLVFLISNLTLELTTNTLGDISLNNITQMATANSEYGDGWWGLCYVCEIPNTVKIKCFELDNSFCVPTVCQYGFCY